MSTSKSLVTRKPSWRKGKRATAVRVWRPHGNAISYCLWYFRV